MAQAPRQLALIFRRDLGLLLRGARDDGGGSGEEVAGRQVFRAQLEERGSPVEAGGGEIRQGPAVARADLRVAHGVEA